MNPTIRSKNIYGIASIMKYVHQKKIIHLDLQIGKIFIDENCEPKISGFELAEYVGTHDYLYDGVFGAPLYLAPEIFMDSVEPYSLSADVYSYAMILYKMFANSVVFDDKKPIRSSQQFMMKISRCERPVRPDHIPDSYWELIQRCWKQEPQDRPTFEEIVEELKHDIYSIEEYGMKTNLDELHEYQKRIDSYKISGSTITSEKSADLEAQIIQLQNQVTTLKSILLPQNINKMCDNNYIDEKFHQVICKIGEGATSVVYKVLDTKHNQILCKKILKYIENSDLAFKTLKNTMNEFDVLRKLNHPCICRAIGINTSEVLTDSNISKKEGKGKEITTVALFLEYEDYSIQEYLENMSNTLKTKIAVEIAHAMKFIHQNGLIHRDLKIDNIRLNCIFEAKIIDFGLVRIHEILSKNYSFVKESMTKGVGTLVYMSPEMLNEEDYDYKTDVYSYGIVLYYFFIGSLPKQNLKDKMAGKTIQMPNPSQSISKCCIDIISKCLSYKPSERPSFEQILTMIRNNSYSLASFVDSNIVSRRDNELKFYEESTK